MLLTVFCSTEKSPEVGNSGFFRIVGTFTRIYHGTSRKTAVFIFTLMRTSSVMISVTCHETAIFVITPVRNRNLMTSVTCHETANFIITPVRNWNLMTSVTCHETTIFIVTHVRNWNLMTSVTFHETAIFIVTLARNWNLFTSITCHETAIFIVTPVRNWNLMISVTCYEIAIFMVTPVRKWNLMTSVTCRETPICIVTPVRNWNLMTFVTCHETAIFILTPVWTSGTKKWRFWSTFFKVKWHTYLSISHRLRSKLSHFYAVSKRTVFRSLIEKFFELTLTKMFIRVFTTVRHWTLPSWVPSTLCLHIPFLWGLFVGPYKRRCNRLFVEGITSEMLETSWNVMAHAQKPDFVFRRNGRVHLNRRGHQFSRLLSAEVCVSAVVMLDTPCSEVVWRILATYSIRQFPLHFPSRASSCGIIFQPDSSTQTPHTKHQSLSIYSWHVHSDKLRTYSQQIKCFWRKYRGCVTIP